MTTINSDHSPLSISTIEDVESISHQDLKQLFTRLNKYPPPLFASRVFLRLNIAWMLQVIEMGDDPSKVRNDLLKQASKVSISSKTQYLPGTRLIREWHGVTHEVIIEETGYRWKNIHYRSLSKIAQEITGTHWSGPRFFGLKNLDLITSKNN